MSVCARSAVRGAARSRARNASSRSARPASRKRSSKSSRSVSSIKPEGQGDEGRVEAPGEKGSPRGRRLEASRMSSSTVRRQSRADDSSSSTDQVRREGGDDPEGDPERTRLEALPHRLEEQHLVQDPEGLLMGLPPEHGEQDRRGSRARRAARRRSALEPADLKRERGLRDEDALRRPAERAAFDHRVKIA